MAYSVEIIKTSTPISKKQEVQLKNLNGNYVIDTLIDESGMGFYDIVGNDIQYTAQLHIHNDRSENPEYDLYCIIMVNGEVYTTGSPYLTESSENIIADMNGVEETWSLRCIKCKGDKGSYLTATIV